jgi:hypothetical protein
MRAIDWFKVWLAIDVIGCSYHLGAKEFSTALIWAVLGVGCVVIIACDKWWWNKNG